MTVRSNEHIRARCFHPNGMFVEFEKDEVETSIPERFENIVRRYPDRLAVKTREGGRTYDDLNKAANRIARAILRQPDEEGQPVGLLLDHDAPVIAALLGALKAGKFYVPLDPSSPQGRLGYMLKDSDARLLVTNGRNLSLARQLAQNSYQIINIDELDTSLSSSNLGLPISPERLACILYTSGSTGQPKGVLQNHRNVLHFTMTYTNDLHICADDRLTLLHYCSVSASMRNLFGALLNGAAVFPLDFRATGMSHLIAWLIEQEMTIYHSTPTMFRHFVESVTGMERFPKLRLINLSGEAATKSDAMRYQANFSPHCVFVNMWGATETGFVSQYFMDKESVISSPMVPIGYAIQDKQILLLDEYGTAIGFNKIGEIAIRSHYLSPGYWRRPAADRAAFLSDPCEAGQRIYRTGDLGRMLQDGCVLYRERKDFQVKIRGNRVELAEAEGALLEHPLIKEAVIVAREEQPGNIRLVAYVTSNRMPAPNVSELRNFLKEKLPDYMIPSAFVLLDALPHTPNGKIDRNALPAPGQSRPRLQVAFLPPGTPTERTLVQVWADVLKLDQVGVDDNFFDLGGNSLLASQVISRVIKTFTIEIPIALLFDSPTIAKMAAVIDEHQGKFLGDKELANILDELESLPDEKAQQLAAKSEIKK